MTDQMMGRRSQVSCMSPGLGLKQLQPQFALSQSEDLAVAVEPAAHCGHRVSEMHAMLESTRRRQVRALHCLA